MMTLMTLMTLELSPLWLSLKTVTTATIIAFFLGIAVARWMFTYQGKAKGLLDGLLTLPLVLPPTVVGFFLLLIFGKNSFVGQFLSTIGIEIVFSWTATVIAATVVAFPLMYRTTLGAFRQIDQNLINAARTLGASEWTIFWRISLPLAWQGTLAGTILAFARALGEFGATLMLAGNIVGKTQTIPLAIFFAAEAGQMDRAFVWVLMIVAISLAAIAGLNYFTSQKAGNSSNYRGFTLRLRRRMSAKMMTAWEKLQLRETNNALEPRSPAFLNMAVKKENPGFTLDVDFTVASEALGLLGASGSGKSMTLRCLAGLTTPTCGQIVLNGRVLFDSEQKINLPSRQRRIGFLFQNYALFPHMTVAENIAFGLKHGNLKNQRLSPTKINQRVASKIALVHLEGLENRYPHQLSGGQQQRVALARALAIEPEALLLDEPFSALDTYLRAQITKQLIEVLAQYRGVTLFVTHNLAEAYRICSNLLVLCHGRAIAYDSKFNIFERAANLTVARLTECKNFSRARMISATQVEAIDWDCTLQVLEAIPPSLAYVGIRAHHLVFSEDPELANSFPAWLVETSETPHAMTLYLKLHAPPQDISDHHLQAEISKEKWSQLKDRPLPWQIGFNPIQILLLSE